MFPNFRLLYSTKYLGVLWLYLFEFNFFLRCVGCPVLGQSKYTMETNFQCQMTKLQSTKATVRSLKVFFSKMAANSYTFKFAMYELLYFISLKNFEFWACMQNFSQGCGGPLIFIVANNLNSDWILSQFMVYDFILYTYWSQKYIPNFNRIKNLWLKLCFNFVLVFIWGRGGGNLLFWEEIYSFDYSVWIV